MNDDAPASPAGWYASADGKRRYWDGVRWLDVPEPQRSPSGSTAPRGVPLWVVLCVSLPLVLVGIAGGAAAGWSLSTAGELDRGSSELQEEIATLEEEIDDLAK